MTTNDPTPEKRIARDHATDEPDYIGRDEHGAAHFWSMYDQTIIVVEDGDVGTCDFSHVDAPLAHWKVHTDNERGWVECYINSSPLAAVV